MPEPLTILLAMAAAAAVAILCVLELGWPWREPGERRTPVGWVLAIGFGFAIGCWWLNVRPKLSLAEDKDRFLLLVFPAIVVVEMVLAMVGPTKWWLWIPRFVIALGIGRVLLQGSQYLIDPIGGLHWTPPQAIVILGGIGAAVFVVWLALAALHERTAGCSVPVALAVACVAVGVQTMNSGYVNGGQLLIPLAAALVAAALASYAVAGAPPAVGGLGVAFVCYSGVLVAGKFFGGLPTTYAVFWLAAPLLCWLPELPKINSLSAWKRGVVRVALIVVPLVPVLWSAAEEMRAQSGKTSPMDEYEAYGK